MSIWAISMDVLRSIRVIEDVIGRLPSRYFNLLLKKEVSRCKRFEIVCFLYVNGCPLELFFDLREACGDFVLDKSLYWRKYSEIDGSARLRNRYYSFNIVNNRYEYLNGRVFVFSG